jgi:hypothetical protein
METYTHVSSWIRTHDPSVSADEDISWLSPRGHCDRLLVIILRNKYACTVQDPFIKHEYVLILNSLLSLRGTHLKPFSVHQNNTDTAQTRY